MHRSLDRIVHIMVFVGMRNSSMGPPSTIDPTTMNGCYITEIHHPPTERQISTESGGGGGGGGGRSLQTRVFPLHLVYIRFMA